MCTGRYTYTFKDNERLCAVCAGKRFLREQFGSGGIPSTSTIAVSAWLSEIVRKLENGKSNDFVYKLTSTIIPRNGTRVQGNSNKNDILLILRVVVSFPIRTAVLRKIVAVTTKKRRSGQKALEKMLSGHSKPPKYYTILSIDGDSMGKNIRRLNDKERHKEVSKKLSAFTKYVYETIKSRYHGYVVYHGGDEGMILLPLSETMDFMNEIRKEFAKQITSDGESFSLSAGAAIVHHQSPLGRGLKAANDALRKAKDIEGKNAFRLTFIYGADHRFSAPHPGKLMVSILLVI